MKIIDQTPFYKENGELSLLERSQAALQFGMGWFKEVEAQNSVIAVLDKILDKSYILLHNVIPPGMEARIPLILVGPTGVYVMYVTALVGLYRAKGDQWGTITGNSFRPERPNLLIRTERMARAVQVFLQRQGFTEPSSVEAVLLCANPSFNIDSLRPIIRVVMRDALEYFAGSITQARVVLTPQNARAIVDHLLKPMDPIPAPQPRETDTIRASFFTPQAGPEEDPYVPAFALPGAENASAGEMPVPPSWFAQPAETPASKGPPAVQSRRRRKLSRKQWGVLISMFIVWCLLSLAIAFLVVKDLFL